MGRPRKPTEALERSGGLRSDRHEGRKNQPRFDGTPARPTTLTAEARKHWDQVVPKLVEGGVAKELDGPALVVMCESWAEFRAALNLKTIDDVFTGVRALNLKEQRLRQMLMNAALKQWRDIAARFGLTPADRARLEVAPDGEEKNAFESIWQQPEEGKTKGKAKK